MASTSFAPKAHPSASFYANGPMPTSSGYQCPAVWEPSTLISSLGHTDEEEPSISFNGSQLKGKPSDISEKSTKVKMEEALALDMFL